MYTKRNLLVTTTNTIEGATIQEYRGVIAANIVMGISIIKEFVAAFSDFLEEHLESMVKRWIEHFILPWIY